MTRAIIAGAAALVIALGGIAYWAPWDDRAKVQHQAEMRPLVVNEAARTLLYLPLYHAARMGYFKDEAIDVKIVTGGSAATAVAAMITGDADIAQADPMYAPISQAKGSDVVVIGQIVGRIGLWALARPGTNIPFDGEGLKGVPIITHPKPMTSFTYTELLLQQFGITEQEANFIEAKPGTEVATFNAETRAPFIVTLEPAVSILEDQGAKIVYSWPEKAGPRVFTGLMVRKFSVPAKSRPVSRSPTSIPTGIAGYRRTETIRCRDSQGIFPKP